MGNQFSESVSTQQKVQAIENESTDEFDLLDVVNFIRRNFIYLLGGMLLGVAIALILAVFLPEQYQAKALVKVGEIGNVNATGIIIEPSLQVVDRIKSQSFQDDVLQALNVSVEYDDDVLVKQFRKNLNVKLEKSELISLSLKALSRAEAIKNMQEVVNQLNKSHNRMSYPTISRLKLELVSVNNELKFADKEMKQLSKTLEMQTEKITDMKFSQSVLLNSLRMSKEQEYRNFRDSKRILEERLSPERTFPTHVLGRVEVSKKPVYPNYSIFVGVGLLLGLFAGLLYILARGLKLKQATNHSIN